MSRTKAELKHRMKGNEISEEIAKSRIIEAARAHILEDLKVDELQAITFGLGFSLDVDW